MNKNKEMEEIKKTISDKFYDAMDINANVSALMGRKICEEVVSQAILSAEERGREEMKQEMIKDGWRMSTAGQHVPFIPDQEQLSNSKTE